MAYITYDRLTKDDANATWELMGVYPLGAYRFIPSPSGNSMSLYRKADPGGRIAYDPGELNPANTPATKSVDPPTRPVPDRFIGDPDTPLQPPDQADYSDPGAVTEDAVARAIRRTVSRDGQGHARTISRAATTHGIVQARKARINADEIADINAKNKEFYSKK